MKRKVIKQGNGTLTITLPKQWTEEIGLGGSDEVEIKEIENGLLISTPYYSKEKSISYNIDDFERLALAKFLIASFEEGYENITLTFSKSSIVSWSNGKEDLVELVNFFLGRLVGFEVLKQTKKSITIGNLSEKLVKFENILSRIFFLIDAYQQYLVEIMKTNNLQELQNYENRHDNITKLCSLGLRIIYQDPAYTRFQALHYSTILNYLDKVADFIRYACKNCLILNKKVSKETIGLAEKTYKYLELYRHFFYKFDYKLINELDESRGDMKKSFISLSKRNKEPSINAQFDALVETLQGTIKSRIALEMEKEIK